MKYHTAYLMAQTCMRQQKYARAVELFDLPGRFSASIWWLGIGAGTLVVGLVGWLATRRLLAVPPMQVLNSG